MQIFYSQGVISGSSVDENSLVYCVVQRWRVFQFKEETGACPNKTPRVHQEQAIKD